MPTRKSEAWTWQRAWELLDRAERLNRTFFLRRVSASRPVWEPPVDVFESQAQFLVVVALPGVQAERVELAVSGNQLVVAGERSRPQVCEHLTVRRMEIPHGRFERRIELPPGRYQLASRELVDGCLVVALDRL